MVEKFQSISLSKIKVAKYNVRTKNIKEGIEDLAENIRAVGLLEPLVSYYEPEKEHYVILTGQRRLNAYHHLNKKYPGSGFDKILCRVIDEPETDEKKRALSLAENITQVNMTKSDLIKAVTDLYNVYGDYDMVRDKFGITKVMVDKYVRISRLPNELREAVRDGEIHSNPKKSLDIALSAVKATGYVKNGPYPTDTVVELAKAMGQNPDIAVGIAKEARRGISPKEATLKAKKRKKEFIKIGLDLEIAEKLRRVASTQGDNERERATQYVIDGTESDYKLLGDNTE